MDRSSSGLFSAGTLLNGRYESLSPLNHGSFGMVSLAKDIRTGNQVALKMLAKPSAGLGLDSRIKVDDRSEELKIHSLIGHHNHIVNLLDSFETPNHSYLVLEFCSQGDLYEAIRLDKGPKETEHVRDFMFQFVDAVEHLHSKGIFHRDIKPENIFLTEDGAMKLGDFGLATMDPWSYEIAVGSDRYMAPEQFDPQGNGLAPGRADIWSIGVCLLNILFSRNPFSEPAPSDPLFTDFVNDRQSLFDVFPNMSSDTFEVLSHCLVIDPEKRSLSALREALSRVVSFTLDDESSDDFGCNDNRDAPVTATANREPLRTPSVASPNMDQGQAFPWAQALLSTPQKPQRRLSTLHDEGSFTDELFPSSRASGQDWTSKADTQSIESVVDSGLGVSIGSKDFAAPVARSKPVPIAGSLPAYGGRASRALSSFFGKKKQFESKSWSDLWDEEEEERIEHEREHELFAGHRVAQLSQVDSESEGRSTPRAAPVQLAPRVPSQASEKPQEADAVSQHTGFTFEEEHQTPTPGTPLAPAEKGRYSPPAKRSTFMDKWSTLGDRRRQFTATVKETSPFDSGRSRFSPSGWRRSKTAQRQTQQRVDHGVWKNQAWNLSTDWRRSDHHLPHPSPLQRSQLDGPGSDESDFEHAGEHSDDDLTGPEWVGGWKDLHL